MAIALTPLGPDQQILDFLYRRYYPELRAAAERRVRDPHLAEDMAQEAFKRAAERGNLADIEQRRAYIHAILRNLRSEVARMNDVEGAVVKVDSNLVSHATEFPTVHPHGMTAVECAVELMRVVEQLKGRRATVFKLSLTGDRNTEIALKLGISPEAVAQDLMHARRELSTLMKLRGGAADAHK